MPRKTKRPRFLSKRMMFIACEAGNLRHENGDTIAIITLAGKESGDIMPVFLTMKDTQRLAAELLIALWTNDDDFAGKVLMEKFPHDQNGHFHWPVED